MHTEFLHFRSFEEIENYWLATLNVEPSLLQLSSGPLDFKVRNDDLSGVLLTWVTSTGRQFWRDWPTGGGVHFGFMIDSKGPVYCGGRELQAADALMWLPEHEIDYLLEGPLRSLEISVSAELVDELCWRAGGQPVKIVDKAALGKLLQICTMASEWLGACDNLHEDLRLVRGRLWREWILDALSHVVVPWIKGSGTVIGTGKQWTRYFEIVRKTEKRFDMEDPDIVSDADLIAKDLGISRRSLFYAFQHTLGMGPRKYFELQRLHELRRALNTAEAEQVSVTDLATRFGFTQLGRMAGIYKKHFGETPSETLKKTA